MKEIFTMWKYPKMIVLTVVSAALYAITLIPFKGYQLIPGVAEIRPAAVLPPLLGILFGPAGAWGCAIGNTVGDYFGKTLTERSAFGAAGNFCFALVPYLIWYGQEPRTRGEDFSLANPQHLLRYVAVCMIACASVALIIAWGSEWFKHAAFASLASGILINNLAATLVLGPFLFKLLYSRSTAWNLLWARVMPDAARSSGILPVWGARLIWIGAAGGLAIGLFISHAFYQNPFLEASTAGATDPAVLWATAPFLVLFFLGCMLA